MKRILIYVFFVITIVAVVLYCYIIKCNNYDSKEKLGVFVLKAYYKTDTIYSIKSSGEIYELLNMKIIDSSKCENIIFESMVKHSAIQVDSLLFDKLSREKVQVVNEVHEIYDKSGIFAVLDHYMKKNNVLKDVDSSGMSFEAEEYIIYLAYLHNIYFNYTYILGDGYVDFYFTLEEQAYKKLIKYRDSIKER